MKNNNNVEFYYGRVNKIGGVGEMMSLPVVTVAVRFNTEDGTVNRGISICSMNECPNKKVGKELALKRLYAAETARRNIQPINYGVSKVRSSSNYPTDVSMFQYKGLYNDQLNEIEQIIFDVK